MCFQGQPQHPGTNLLSSFFPVFGGNVDDHMFFTSIPTACMCEMKVERLKK